jgi:IS30 family transposase
MSSEWCSDWSFPTNAPRWCGGDMISQLLTPWLKDYVNENTNGLLRQYFPKGMDLSKVHQNRLNAVARRLSERLRETLNFETAAERFNQCVASTH